MTNDSINTVSTIPAQGNEAPPGDPRADTDTADGNRAAPDGGTPDDGQCQEPEGCDPSQADVLVSLAASGEFFKTSADEAYASVRVGMHHETHLVASTAFERYLSALFYHIHGTPPDPRALRSALGVIEGHARFSGDTKDVFVRIGGRGGNVYLDLANKNWR